MADRGKIESPGGRARGSKAAGRQSPGGAIGDQTGNLVGVLDFRRMLAIADALPVLIAYLDSGQRYLFVNRALADWLGMPRRQVLGRSMRDVLGEEAYKSREPMIRAALAGERQWFAANFDHPTRGPLAVQSEYVPQRGADGSVEGVVLLIQDVTEQRAAERSLRESEARFRRIADSAPALMWVSRLDRSRDFVNEAYAEFVGLDVKDACQFDWRAAIHPDDAERVVAESIAGEASLKRFTLEARYRRADGEYRWLRSVSQPRFGPDGELVGFIGVGSDVTAEKDAESELKAQVAARTAALGESEARVRALFDSALEMIGLLDLDGRYVEVNRSALDSLGLTPEQVVGKHPWEIGPFSGHPESQEKLRQLVGQAAGGATATAEMQIDTVGGQASLIVSMKPVMGDDGKPMFLLGEGRDITELKSTQDQLRQAQKMEALGQLTGGIAHDFNNLLTVVVGGLDLITKRVEDEKLLRYATNALSAAERGARLTAQLLAFSRVQRLEVKPTYVAPLIEEMRPLLRNVLGPGIEKVFDLDPHLMPVMADPTQLEVAVLNLAINARDAMPEGGTLTISSRRRRISDDPELEPGHYVELSISDTGEGMTPEVLARAIEPFFTTKEVGKGTGLGLSMVYGMTRQSGGTARIESEPGVGTTVKLYFRRATRDAEVPLSNGETGDMLRRQQGKATILVIDDDDDVRQFIAASLEEYGHEVVEAADGREGIDRFAEVAPDLVILDFVMPGLSGAEVAAHIRATKPGQRILFVSGYSETDAIRKVAPDAEILPKPFRATVLDEAVRDALATS
ncbi:PAS domain S-box protein [Sphingomonas edaphi]|uniref:histidine kinase n=1 Tax=Sphingomonas edaphi TaxID=2315689 RepID=A0A418PY22_9SPHN|nr:PAS domain S-box protein [Sphingomonas edaphi]RIX26812.1 PAS domain S-box protein [Sphingomonas edaphi]